MTYVFMHFVYVCVYMRRPEIDTGYVPLDLTLILRLFSSLNMEFNYGEAD